jgi:hypothetical protein
MLRAWKTPASSDVLIARWLSTMVLSSLARASFMSIAGRRPTVLGAVGDLHPERASWIILTKREKSSIGLRRRPPVRSPIKEAYFAGLGCERRGGVKSSSISAKLRSSCNAACLQVLAMSSNTWRCRSDLVSSAQRKHSCANSRNSLGDAAMARSPRHSMQSTMVRL